MSKIKYFLSSIIILIGLFICGETPVKKANYRLNTFSDACYLFDEEYTASENKEQLELFKGVITDVSQRSNVDMFICVEDYVDDLETTFTIYYTKGAKASVVDSLNGRFNYSGIITGKTLYEIKPIDQLEVIEKETYISFVGKDSDVHKAKKSLGEHFTEDKQHISGNSEFESMESHIDIAVLALILVLIMLLCICDTNFRRKEFTLRFVYGEKRSGMIAKYMLKDVLVFSVIIIAQTLSLALFNNILYSIKTVVAFSIILILMQFFCYLPLLRVNPVLVFKGQTQKKKVLASANTIKILVSVLIVCVFSALVSTYISSLGYIKAADFFKEHSTHSFLSYKDDVDFSAGKPPQYEQLIAGEYYEQCRPILIENCGASSTETAEDDYIFVNSLGFSEYLVNAVDEASQNTQQYDYTVILPKSDYSERILDKCIDEINSTYDAYFDDIYYYSRENIQIILADDYSLFAADDSSASQMSLFSNIPIIIDNIPENESRYSYEERNFGSRMYLFRMDDSLRQEIAEKYSLVELTVTNGKKNYDYFWRTTRLALIYFGVFSVMMLVLEITLVMFKVKMEFELNKEEICIRKVLGYSFIERYMMLILSTLSNTLICFAISVALVTAILGDISVLVPIVIASILFILEFVMIVFKSASVEKANIQRILKGDAL